MTCIIGTIDKEKKIAFFIADNLAIDGHSFKKINECREKLVLKEVIIEDYIVPIVFGVSGSEVVLDFLKYTFDKFDCKKIPNCKFEPNTTDWMVSYILNHFVPQFKKKFMEYYDIDKFDKRKMIEYYSYGILIGTNDKLFEINSNGTLRKDMDVAIVGSGKPFLSGYYVGYQTAIKYFPNTESEDTTKNNDEDIWASVEEALYSVSQHNVSVGSTKENYTKILLTEKDKPRKISKEPKKEEDVDENI